MPHARPPCRNSTRDPEFPDDCIELVGHQQQGCSPTRAKAGRNRQPAGSGLDIRSHWWAHRAPEQPLDSCTRARGQQQAVAVGSPRSLAVGAFGQSPPAEGWSSASPNPQPVGGCGLLARADPTRAEEARRAPTIAGQHGRLDSFLALQILGEKQPIRARRFPRDCPVWWRRKRAQARIPALTHRVISRQPAALIRANSALTRSPEDARCGSTPWCSRRLRLVKTGRGPRVGPPTAWRSEDRGRWWSRREGAAAQGGGGWRDRAGIAGGP